LLELLSVSFGFQQSLKFNDPEEDIMGDLQAFIGGSRSRFLWLSLMSLILATAFVPQTSYAQVLYGSIIGNVKDSSGGAVPGASVSITNKSTNQSRESVTDELGNYSLTTVQTGNYTMKVSLTGFKEFLQTDVQVALNTVTRVDVTLEVGQVAETVTVSAQAVTLQTDRAEVKSELNTKALQDLPVPMGRNYQGLFKTLPGFSMPENAHSIPSNPSRALAFNVNGASRSSNNIRIDGVTGTNVWLPHMTSYIPALESIDAVNVVTNSFDAEQGLAGGAAVNVQIKSGTNELHGSAFEYHSDNALKARPYFTPVNQRNPKLVYNQFGATLGGPIMKDKLFYFASYEGTYDHQFASRTVSVPTPEMKRGDFSASPNPIYDPATGDASGAGRTPFPGNIIPANRIDSIAANINARWPDPNIPGLAPGTISNNFYKGDSFYLQRHTLDTKLNWNITPKLAMNGRFSILDYSMHNPEIFGDQLGGTYVASYGGNSGEGWGKTYSTTIGANYVVSPKFIVDANFGWTRMDTNIEQCCLDENIGRDVLGIPGTNGTRRFEGGWPDIEISNFANIGVNDNFMPYYRSDPQWQYTANANWIKGSHNVRFGYDSSHQNLNHTQPEFAGASYGAQGGFEFQGGPTQIAGGPGGNAFNSYATFLLGLPTRMGRILQVPDVYSTRTWAHSLYIRDSWQAHRKFTLTIGTRWEYFPIPTRPDRGLELYDINTNKMQVCGVGSIPVDCGVKMSKTMFAPRVGLAWRVTEDFVVRAGYGLTNDPYNLARPMRTNHPILLALTVPAPNTLSAAGTLRTGIPAIPVPDLGNGIIDVPGNIGVNYLPTEFKRGYIQSWNLMLQHTLPLGFVGQAGYVATRTIRQLGQHNINVQKVGGGLPSAPLNQKFGRVGSTQYIGPIGGSHYDSMQLTLDRRFAHGFQMNLAYTFSKAIGAVRESDSDNSPAIQLFEYYHLNRSLLNIHRPHNFQLSTINELPFGRGKKWLNNGGFGSAILGGWQVNAIFSRQSGVPLSVTASGTSLNAAGNTQRADQVKTNVEYLGGHGRGESWFDPFAFAPVTEARFGTVGYNTLIGPRYSNIDVGLFREFKLTERVGMQFRAEAFNFTNTPHFGNPGLNRSDMTLNPDGSIRSLGGYTEITSTRGTGREGIDERQFRFGLRVSF
jgi:Carboxypeptidase regulatory-like domain/TonB dependent receptor-like, beta-barrel